MADYSKLLDVFLRVLDIHSSMRLFIKLLAGQIVDGGTVDVSERGAIILDVSVRGGTYRESQRVALPVEDAPERVGPAAAHHRGYADIDSQFHGLAAEGVALRYQC